MSDKIAEFRALHVPGDPLILINIWDAGSAKAVAAAGAKAIATGSFGVAGAQGRADGEDFPIEDVFENLARILAVTDLPVTIDMESGYGADPAAVSASVARARDAGAAGLRRQRRDTARPPTPASSSTRAATPSAAPMSRRMVPRWSPQRSNARAPMPMRARDRCSCLSCSIPNASARSATPRRCR